MESIEAHRQGYGICAGIIYRIKKYPLSSLFCVLLLWLNWQGKAAEAITLPAGFQETIAFSGLTEPTAVRFSPDGRVFVGEKGGVIKVFDDLDDPTPRVLMNLGTKVHSYWDRGLLGMTLDPDFPTKPFIYVLYTYDAGIGGTAPQWNDTCPTPPGPTTDGCVVTGRLSRMEVSSTNKVIGGEQVLIQDQWCQQFPSHSVGSLVFGPEGALYVSAGEGAGFSMTDYGQFGGSEGSITPRNPCDDPPTGLGGTQTPPLAEGGALRSQDVRTAGDPVTYAGSILRINPDTGQAWPSNYLIGGDSGDDAIIAYGLRNPFRFTIRPGTSEVWIGDVGWSTWEEIDRITNPNGITNFGWPCYEGVGVLNAYAGPNLTLCESLYAQGPSAVAAPFYTYRHADKVSPTGDACGIGSSSITGLAFYTAGVFPSDFANALFFADYSRNCIYVIKAGPQGNLNLSTRTSFAADAGEPVDLQIGPGGDLFFVDHGAGTIRRIEFSAVEHPPVAIAGASPTAGKPPLHVNFDASQSSDPDPGATLRYKWDLDGDGQYDDSKRVNPSYEYPKKGHDYVVKVGLKVIDDDGFTDTDEILISVGNTAPTSTILAPLSTFKWKVGDVISFEGEGTDDEDGQMSPSSMRWQLVMHHCPSNCHTHSLQSFVGVSSGTFTAPDHEWYSYLELKYTVTDSGGLSTEKSVFLDPKTVDFIFRTVPSGLNLAVNGLNSTTPFTTRFIIGSVNSVSAPTPQNVTGVPYFWTSWSDGGAQSHEILAGVNAKIFTARYCPLITLSPSSLPQALPGQAYNQTIVAAGGAPPYTFAKTSGNLPPGLNLSNSGVISGTPTVIGSFSFTIAATDATGCTATRSYSLNLLPLLLDDFTDSQSAWDVTNGNWTESNGTLDTTTDGKATAFAPVPWIPSGVSTCIDCKIQVEDVTTSGGEDSTITIIGWYQNDKNKVDLTFEDEKNTVILEQKVNGTTVAKKKAPLPISPNTPFDVILSFSASTFEVTVNGNSVLTLITSISPAGKVGFGVKKTSGSFGKIIVN